MTLLFFHPYYPDSLASVALAALSPVALHVSDVQDGVGVARAESQRFVNDVVHLHVPAPAGSAHQEPVQGEEAGG